MKNRVNSIILIKVQKQNRKLFFSKFSKLSPERDHQEVLETGIKLLVHFSNFCLKIVRVTVTLSKMPMSQK